MKNIQITSDIVTIDCIQYKRVIAEQKSEYQKILSFKDHQGDIWVLHSNGNYGLSHCNDDTNY